ncbi:undecaprenyl/decaprenyl-phosphate alpha-N-acetylglucosaminyl 1-phosphate transferase [Candidatus Daviesbacteria bacterium]|nr:undecaprenyl/decaprenyl-phosphate alpha-N-acetylglucosaminyl 1-phosphate transferase [Candidatus Daviesbacteria bacterium]
MNFFLPLLFSFAATSLGFLPTIWLAKKFNLVDNPRLRPHPAHTQKRVVPRAGGLLPFIGIVSAIIIFLPLTLNISGILAGLTILLAIGLLDDRYPGFSPYLRLLGQFIASAFVVFSGIGINFITNPLGGIIDFPPLLSYVLALVWIVWVMNMINWSKGVDGQMPSIATVASLILGLLSLKLTLNGDPNQVKVAILAFITTGASLGLLIFNWHPAKIFPGFSGSNILGFMIATLAILSGAKLATAGLVLLIPATDFAYTFFRRILQGKSPVWGDRGHLHHKLLELGLTHQKIALFYLLGSVILGAVALSLSSSGKLFAAILVATVILGVILWLNFFGGLSKPEDPGNG